MSGDTRLSVIVAAADCRATVIDSIAAIMSDCGPAAEVLLVDASRDGTAETAAAAFPVLRVLTAPAGTLVPVLWAIGIEASAGAAVALTTAHCIVRRGWSQALLRELAAGAAGAGGSFELDPAANATDRAVFLLRYSAFLCGGAPRVVADIAADNGAYARTALERHAEAWRDGFWEVEFHRRLVAADGELRFVPDACVAFRAGAVLRAYMRQRFEHGRHFGAWRAGRERRPAALRVLAAPLVPAVLLARIGRRALDGGAGTTFLRALPRLAVLAGAWAAGEAVGAAVGLGRASRSTAAGTAG
jgi:hypothetical protein